MRLSRRALLWGLPGLLVVACISPTLPLPPPAPPDVEQIGQGQYRLQGVIPFSGTVLVLNQRTQLVYGKVVDDVYSLDVLAEPGDDMTLWYESGQDVSDITDFTIDDNAPMVDAGVPPDAGTDASIPSGDSGSSRDSGTD